MILFLSFALARDLSYEEALLLALEQNPQLHSAHADLKSAEAGLLAAQGIFDPRATMELGRSLSTNQQLFAGVGAFNTQTVGPSGSVGLQGLLPYGTSFSWNYQVSRTSSRFKLENVDSEQEFSPFDTSMRFNISQPLLEGALTGYNLRQVREAKQSIDLAELRLLEQRQNLLAEVGKSYWSLRHQELLLELARESLSIATEEARLIAAQVKEGNFADVENDRVESARLASESALIDAENSYRSATEALLLQLGLPLAAELTLTSEEPQTLNKGWDESTEVEKSLSNNPSILLARAQKEQSELRLKDAKHARLPELSLTASYTLSGWEEAYDDALSELFQRDLPGSYLGLSLNAPLGNWADKGTYEQRVADVEKSRLSLKSLEQNINQQTRLQVRTLRSTEVKLRLAQSNVDVARKTLIADRELRDAGRKIEKDVLDSIKAEEEAQAQLARARADHHQALLELARLQGALLKK